MPNNTPAATGPQEVPAKVQVKHHVLAKAPDITVGFLVANGPSGPFTELSALATANKKLNELTKVIMSLLITLNSAQVCTTVA